MVAEDRPNWQSLLTVPIDRDATMDPMNQEWGKARLNLEAQILQTLASLVPPQSDESDTQTRFMIQTPTLRDSLDPNEITVSDLSTATPVSSGSAPEGCFSLSPDDWPENTTTVMIRHIPCKYSQRKLMKEINDAGFLGHYDFFYLPMDPRSRANRGFAFINLDLPETAKKLCQAINGKRLRHFNSEKVLAVAPADLQGFDANAAHYAASRVLRVERNPHHRPLFFRPLPQHLFNTGIRNANDGGFSPSHVSVPATKLETKGTPQELVAPATTPSKEDSAKPPGLPLAHDGYGEPMTAGARYCGQCGKAKDTAHRFCPFCGTKSE